jgi:hypothetical protein
VQSASLGLRNSATMKFIEVQQHFSWLSIIPSPRALPHRQQREQETNFPLPTTTQL